MLFSFFLKDSLIDNESVAGSNWGSRHGGTGFGSSLFNAMVGSSWMGSDVGKFIYLYTHTYVYLYMYVYSYGHEYKNKNALIGNSWVQR